VPGTRWTIPQTELTVSPIALGLGDFGTRVSGRASRRLLEAYLAQGGNFVDTAHCYSAWLPDGAGRSERELGRCLAELSCRDALVVATKGGHPAFAPYYHRAEHYLAPEVVRADVDESLARLGIECIDLYYLHRDDARVPVGEVIDSLNEEIARGRVRYLGASNWSVARIEAANAYAAAEGRVGFCISEVHFSLAEPSWPMTDDPTVRHLTATDRAWHARSGLPVAAYSPTARGFMAGRPEVEAEYAQPPNLARRERARELATQLGCTPTQVALAWLMHQPFPVVPITGTNDLAHLAEVVGASEVELSDQQVAHISG
jgi:aryl-alcohol dehydrogenase-like predicted oxidoreductase